MQQKNHPLPHIVIHYKILPFELKGYKCTIQYLQQSLHSVETRKILTLPYYEIKGFMSKTQFLKYEKDKK